MIYMQYIPLEPGEAVEVLPGISPVDPPSLCCGLWTSLCTIYLPLWSWFWSDGTFRWEILQNWIAYQRLAVMLIMNITNVNIYFKLVRSQCLNIKD